MIRARRRARRASHAPSHAPLSMALSRPLFVGFSSASKVAREGGDLEVTVLTARGPRTFTLPWFFVRQVDALLERWRREEHEATLLTMNDGELGETLVEAAAKGGLRDATFLIASGADVEYSTKYNGVHVTALAEAAWCGHLEVATMLVDAGAEMFQSDAFCFAAYQGHTAIVALLLDRGIELDDEENPEPLRGAAEDGHLDTVWLLLDRGANVHADDEAALRAARSNGHEAVVALLLERGAVDIPDEE